MSLNHTRTLLTNIGLEIDQQLNKHPIITHQYTAATIVTMSTTNNSHLQTNELILRILPPKLEAVSSMMCMGEGGLSSGEKEGTQGRSVEEGRKDLLTKSGRR